MSVVPMVSKMKPKAPSKRYFSVEGGGVEIVSRRDFPHEISAMAVVLECLLDSDTAKMLAIHCGREAACYEVKIMPGFDQIEHTMPLAEKIGDLFTSTSGGHNGVSVGITATIDPEWWDTDGARLPVPFHPLRVETSDAQ